MRRNRSPFFPLIILFLITNAFFLWGKNFLERNGVDQDVLIIGNIILFTVTILSAWINTRNISSTNPHRFVRGIYLSAMLKLFICAIAAFIYILVLKDSLNKPALIINMGLYILYTVIEVTVLSKILRGKKNV